MVAYSFKGRFDARIRARSKIQTIRKVGKKRHTRPGERLTMTTGDRFHPRSIGSATCVGVQPITLDFAARRVIITTVLGIPAISDTPEALEAFDQMDGFDSWDDLCAFWRATHGDLETFTGLLILWGDSFEAAA